MSQGKILASNNAGIYALKFFGDVRLTLGTAVDSFLKDMISDRDLSAVFIDLADVEGIDSTTLGFIAKISIMTKRNFNVIPTIISTNDNITKILLSMCFDEVFNIIDQPLNKCDSMYQLNDLNLSELEAKEKVLEAHKILMQMNDKNMSEFKDLVAILEKS